MVASENNYRVAQSSFPKSKCFPFGTGLSHCLDSGPSETYFCLNSMASRTSATDSNLIQRVIWPIRVTSDHRETQLDRLPPATQALDAADTFTFPGLLHRRVVSLSHGGTLARCSATPCDLYSYSRFLRACLIWWVQAADIYGERRSLWKGAQSMDCVWVESIIFSLYCGTKRMAACLCRYVSSTMAKQRSKCTVYHRDSDLQSRNIRLAQRSAYIRINYVVVYISEQSRAV